MNPQNFLFEEGYGISSKSRRVVCDHAIKIKTDNNWLVLYERMIPVSHTGVEKLHKGEFRFFEKYLIARD